MKPQTPDERNRQQLIAQNKEASIPILKDLADAGFIIESIDDLYNSRINYKQAIPILLYWLPRVENPAVKEAIVRALSVRWAKNTEAPSLLVEEFRRSKSHFGLSWAIGNALSVLASDDILDDLIGLIEDNTYGKAREMLVVALANMKTQKVKKVLIDVLEDDNLAGYAIMALGKLKATEERSIIERFLTHPKSWIRREAKKALARMEKASRGAVK